MDGDEGPEAANVAKVHTPWNDAISCASGSPGVVRSAPYSVDDAEPNEATQETIDLIYPRTRLLRKRHARDITRVAPQISRTQASSAACTVRFRDHTENEDRRERSRTSKCIYDRYSERHCDGFSSHAYILQCNEEPVYDTILSPC